MLVTRNQKEESKLLLLKKKLKKNKRNFHYTLFYEVWRWDMGKKEASRFSTLRQELQSIQFFGANWDENTVWNVYTCTPRVHWYREAPSRTRRPTPGLFCDPIIFSRDGKEVVSERKTRWALGNTLDNGEYTFTKQTCRPWHCEPFLPVCSTMLWECAV